MFCVSTEIALDHRVEMLQRTFDDPPFSSIEWSFSNSFREGCAINECYILARLDDWEAALTLGIRELLRLQKFGLTESEFEIAKATYVKQASREAETFDSSPSDDVIEGLMQYINMGESSTCVFLCMSIHS